jgi:hypothetical protein
MQQNRKVINYGKPLAAKNKRKSDGIIACWKPAV